MLNFLKQLFLFIVVSVSNGWFKYFFLIVNIIPLVLHLFFGFSAESLITYFLAETLVYCFMHLIYLRLLPLPYFAVKTLLTILCLGLIAISTYFLPLWNKEESTDSSRIAFWNYTALLFAFYTIRFYTVGEKYYDWDETTLKRQVIFKFGILIVVTVLGHFLANYLQNDLGFVIAIIATKTVIDLVTLQRFQMKVWLKYR